jgi:hypothetical protein
MTPREEVDYTVLLIFPGFGTERENAESIIESALDWLNTHKDKPGFRFAYEVNAHLEIVQDADEARARIDEDDSSVAMVFLHDVPDEERDALVHYCEPKNIAAGITVDVPRRPGPRTEPMKVVFRKRPADELRAHQLCAETLTDPVADDDDTGGRVGDVIAVLALGVMQYHWERTYSGSGPNRFLPPE